MQDELQQLEAPGKATATHSPIETVHTSCLVAKGERGWRACKGPQAANTSGFRATGHRLLLVSDAIEETTAGGIVLAKATVDKERSANVYATVIEIGHDAWSDKSTDFCDVGDRVLIGQYTGKFETSKRDGQEYRFVTDLDIISTVEG